MGRITVIVLILLAGAKSENQTCRVIGQTGFMEFSKEADLMMGGVFSMAVGQRRIDTGYKAIPYSFCTRLSDMELKFARVVMFTVEEINRDTDLLPGVSLGYRLYNGCGMDNGIRAAVEAVTGGESKGCSTQIQALYGHGTSKTSEDINKILSALSIPQVSHLATRASLSNKRLYPSFFRTVPSDHFQVIALVELMKYFEWRWVGIIYSKDLPSQEFTADFIMEAKKEGICIEYGLVYSGSNEATSETDAFVQTLRESSAKVVLLFMTLYYNRSFLSDIKPYNISGKQWIGTVGWIADKHLASTERKSILQGALGFAFPGAPIPGLGEFLLSLKPADDPQSDVIRAFWEKFFNCSFSQSKSSTLCTGAEDLRAVDRVYTDVEYFRAENNVYKAVYSVAHALHALLLCTNGSNPTTGKACVDKSKVRPHMVLEHMKYVNFTTPNGDKVFFDENGDSVAQHDFVNWQTEDDGSVKIVNVGHYDPSLPAGEKFTLKKNAKIIWGGNSKEVPRSVCREPCPPGTRKAVNKLKPVCCFDCFKCPEGTMSNTTNSPDCMFCPSDMWPNERKDQCLPKPTEYLTFKEIMGTLLTAISCVGACLSIFITLIFFNHKETPIVKANNSELSFLLLFSLTLCFLCSLTFIGRPSEWSCMLRHTAFGITFVLSISCVLGKTIVVLMAFRATLPGSKVMKWFGPTQQRLSVLTFTLIQVLICIIWLTVNPPFPKKNMKYYKEKIILECALGSAVGFWAVLSYIGLLALLCFILAFLARKLPDSFNEAKLITFSMLIFCAVWITFIPAYVSSPGKFTVAVEVFAILASSYGLLVCIFIPKCYIIIFRPERNSKKHLMGKIPAST